MRPVISLDNPPLTKEYGLAGDSHHRFKDKRFSKPNKLNGVFLKSFNLKPSCVTKRGSDIAFLRYPRSFELESLPAIEEGSDLTSVSSDSSSYLHEVSRPILARTGYLLLERREREITETLGEKIRRFRGDETDKLSRQFEGEKPSYDHHFSEYRSHKSTCHAKAQSQTQAKAHKHDSLAMRKSGTSKNSKHNFSKIEGSFIDGSTLFVYNEKSIKKYVLFDENKEGNYQMVDGKLYLYAESLDEEIERAKASIRLSTSKSFGDVAYSPAPAPAPAPARLAATPATVISNAILVVAQKESMLPGDEPSSNFAEEASDSGMISSSVENFDGRSFDDALLEERKLLQLSKVSTPATLSTRATKSLLQIEALPLKVNSDWNTNMQIPEPSENVGDAEKQTIDFCAENTRNTKSYDIDENEYAISTVIPGLPIAQDLDEEEVPVGHYANNGKLRYIHDGIFSTRKKEMRFTDIDSDFDAQKPKLKEDECLNGFESTGSITEAPKRKFSLHRHGHKKTSISSKQRLRTAFGGLINNLRPGLAHSPVIKRSVFPSRANVPTFKDDPKAVDHIAEGIFSGKIARGEIQVCTGIDERRRKGGFKHRFLYKKTQCFSPKVTINEVSSLLTFDRDQTCIMPSNIKPKSHKFMRRSRKIRSILKVKSNQNIDQESATTLKNDGLDMNEVIKKTCNLAKFNNKESCQETLERQVKPPEENNLKTEFRH